MTIWHALAVARVDETWTTQRQAEATEALPGFATVNHDAGLRLLEARFEIDAPSLDEAARTAAGTARNALGFEPSGITVADVPPETGLRRSLAGNLVGPGECVKILGITRQRFQELAERPPAGFPAPLDQIGATQVYLRADIEAFDAVWPRERTGRASAATVEAAQRLYSAAGHALEAAGFSPGQDIGLSYGAGYEVVMLLGPLRFGDQSAPRAARALADAGIRLLPSHPALQFGRDLVEVLGNREFVRLAWAEDPAADA